MKPFQRLMTGPHIFVPMYSNMTSFKIKCIQMSAMMSLIFQVINLQLYQMAVTTPRSMMKFCDFAVSDVILKLLLLLYYD